MGKEYENNLEQNNFYFNGFKLIDIKQTESHKQLINFFSDLDRLDLRNDSEWEENYADTFDLKFEETIKIDLIRNFLSENNILEKIKTFSGFNYCLGNLIIRKTFSKKSYMSWHRDTYMINKVAIGRTPPLLKLIFYPEINKNKKLQLKIKPASHLMFSRNKVIDKLINLISTEKKIYSSNNNSVLFNSSIYHSVVPPNSGGSFRLIFNFCSENQLIQFKNSKKIKEFF